MLWLLGASCTPIAEINHDDVADSGQVVSAATDGTRQGSASLEAQPGAIASISGPLSEVGQSCQDNAARACSTEEPSNPVTCVSATWQRREACAATERCDFAPGPQQGMCVPKAAECAGHADGEEFCDGDERRICLNGRAQTRACGSMRHCRDATCVCMPGTPDLGDGKGCQVPRDCSVANGGCDPMTVCSSGGGQRVCSACPPGYVVGSGAKGCMPELSGLEVSAGTLVPAFTPSHRSYRVALPLLQQQLTITASAPSSTKLELNGSTASSPWTSPVLPLGEHVLKVRVASDFGVSTTYELTVERTGIQEAYLKATSPGRNNQLGTSIAVSRDTLVVGSAYDDSASGGVNADPSDSSAPESGAAYVFVRRGSTWSQEAYLKADSPVSNQFFGAGVAISQDTVAVGAVGNIPPQTNLPHRGSVHIYVRTAGEWTKQQTLTPSNTGNQDMFGFSLALQGDTLAVGAPYESTVSPWGGAVFVYKREGGKWNDSNPAVLRGNVSQDSELGWAVALDKQTVIAGAISYSRYTSVINTPGAAYVFTQQDTGWKVQQRLQAKVPVDGSTFGWSVAVKDDLAAVAGPHFTESGSDNPSGEVNVFRREGDMWMVSDVLQAPTPRRADGFGSAVAFANGALLIGAVGDASSARGTHPDPSRTDAPYSGAFYSFGLQPDGWVRTAYLKASNAERADTFAEHLAADGDTVVIASPLEDSGGAENDNSLSDSGAVYVFR